MGTNDTAKIIYHEDEVRRVEEYLSEIGIVGIRLEFLELLVTETWKGPDMWTGKRKTGKSTLSEVWRLERDEAGCIGN